MLLPLYLWTLHLNTLVNKPPPLPPPPPPASLPDREVLLPLYLSLVHLVSMLDYVIIICGNLSARS